MRQSSLTRLCLERLLRVCPCSGACARESSPTPSSMVSGAVSVQTHPGQSHVVDLLIPLTTTAKVQVVFNDPHARGETLEVTEAKTVPLRLRALLADQDYRVELRIQSANAEERIFVSFRTLPAQQDEISQFEVENTAGAPDYRFFDLSRTPGVERGAIYLIDATVAPASTRHTRLPRRSQDRSAPPPGSNCSPTGTSCSSKTATCTS